MVQSLVGKSEHQVKAQIVEAGLTRLPESSHRGRRVVPTPQASQHRVVKALDAHAQPVDTNCLQCLQVRQREITRICFERNLGMSSNWPTPGRSKHRLDLGWGQ